MCLGKGFFRFILLLICTFSWSCRFTCLDRFGKFTAINFSHFLSIASFFSLCETLMIQMFDLLRWSYLSEAILTFSVYFLGFFFSWLGNLYCFIFQVTDSFLCPLCSAVEPIHWIYVWVSVFSVLKFPLGSLHLSFLSCTVYFFAGGVIGHFIITSREWKPKLPIQPLLAWLEMNPSVYVLGFFSVSFYFVFARVQRLLLKSFLYC